MRHTDVREALQRPDVRHPDVRHPDVRDATPRANVVLGDLRMRPYGVADRDRLRRMSTVLSPQSLYTRFFAGTPQIPEMYVRALHALDHWNHDALVAMIDDEMVGIAEYVRDRADPERAEIAVLIADHWQRHGVASCLIRYLARLAERRGITEFSADVMLGNAAALAAIRAGWPAARPQRDGGAARFRLPLPQPGSGRGERSRDHEGIELVLELLGSQSR
ncbi:GNAT family N-acetyltransferase [Actinomadura sp. HBU206391]|uniref:GNAT family N-acetyltransferase n=1 Tax=Actinomadura sp. HBU206391 TaxID=2731692 RepID=UPI00164FBD23|nr:GNAT family N-acetyltransferase [Actinomadura sp. HBU206391]MBC6457622.1 GNAT family N-acetyltransferase [Actinomadura sp. HBU206391]